MRAKAHSGLIIAIYISLVLAAPLAIYHTHVRLSAALVYLHQSMLIERLSRLVVKACVLYCALRSDGFFKLHPVCCALKETFHSHSMMYC